MCEFNYVTPQWIFRLCDKKDDFLLFDYAHALASCTYNVMLKIVRCVMLRIDRLYLMLRIDRYMLC